MFKDEIFQRLDEIREAVQFLQGIKSQEELTERREKFLLLQREAV